MRMRSIFLDNGSHKPLPVSCVPRGNRAYRLGFKFSYKFKRLDLHGCDVFGRLLLGVPPRSLKVATTEQSSEAI
jgi:hypothetical protein